MIILRFVFFVGRFPEIISSITILQSGSEDCRFFHTLLFPKVAPTSPYRGLRTDGLVAASAPGLESHHIIFEMDATELLIEVIDMRSACIGISVRNLLTLQSWHSHRIF